MKSLSAAVCLTVLSLSACGDDDASNKAMDGGTSTTHDAGLDAAVVKRGPPPEVIAAAKEWPLANRDYAGTRSNFDTHINKATIAGLTKAWSFELPGSGTFGAATAPAVVLNGVLYYIDMNSNVFAMDAATGKLRWQKLYNDLTGGPNGVAVGYGKVFTQPSDKSFAALDMNTGEELWRAPIEVPKNAGIGLPPIVYSGLVYLSTVPVTATSQYLGGVNGTLYALDEATGKIVWSFETVMDKGLWGHPEINSGGGAWYSPTIDTAHDVMYWGIGNPAPYPGTVEFPNGSSHPGDNLYTNSVLALGALDGKYLWHYQERPHDFLDLDFQNPPVLVDAPLDGGVRKLAIGSGKTGTVVALDTESNGARLWHTAVGRHENDDLTELPEAGVTVYPGNLGGVETPIAYANGTVFVTTCNQGRFFSPTTFGELDATGSSEVIALDVATGAVKWKKDFMTSVNYGSATVINDLLLTATFDGTVYALDVATGEQVWSYPTMGMNAPVTVSGDLMFLPVGGGLGTPNIVALKLP